MKVNGNDIDLGESGEFARKYITDGVSVDDATVRSCIGLSRCEHEEASWNLEFDNFRSSSNISDRTFQPLAAVAVHQQRHHRRRSNTPECFVVVSMLPLYSFLLLLLLLPLARDA